MTQSHAVIALTGATGFVGSHFLRKALSKGHKIKALTRRPQDAQDGVIWIKGSLEDAASLAQLVDGADSVIHIAGVVNAVDRQGFAAGNAEGTARLITAATRANIRHFVHVSSLAATLPELSDYGWSKAEAEKAVKASSLSWSMVRPPAIYGPGDTEMLELFKMARTGFMLMPPKGRLSLIHVDDLVRLLLTMVYCANQVDGTIYEADDGRINGWGHADFAAALGDAVGRKSPPKRLHSPAMGLRLVARLDRMIRGRNARLTPDRARYMAHRNWMVDPDKRPDASLWKPMIPTEKAGLADTARWYSSKGWL